MAASHHLGSMAVSGRLGTDLCMESVWPGSLPALRPCNALLTHPYHGEQPRKAFSLLHCQWSAAHSGGGAVLGELGILDSTKDNSFNFVDDAIAAARRRT